MIGLLLFLLIASPDPNDGSWDEWRELSE